MTYDLIFWWEQGEETYYLICIPAQTIITLIAMLFGTRFLLQIYHHPNPNMSSFYRNTTIICCVSCILCLLTDLSHIYWCHYANLFLFDTLPNRIYSIADFWYYLATNAFYLIAFLRLRFTFRDTAYSLSSRTESMMSLLMLISILTATYYVGVVANMTTVSFFYKWAKPAIFILMVNDCVLNTMLMVLFVVRLKDNIQESETNTSIEWNHFSSDHGEHRLSKYSLSFNQFSSSNKSIIDIITLHTNLFGAAIITNQLFLASLLSGFWFEPIQFYIFVFRGAECCANVMVLYLSFKWNRKSYSKYCRACHRATKQCCIYATKEKVKRKVFHHLSPMNSVAMKANGSPMSGAAVSPTLDSITSMRADDDFDLQQNPGTYSPPKVIAVPIAKTYRV